MTAPQLTFVLTAVLLSFSFTLLFYRGVVRYAQSKRESFVAASMAAVLCATPIAWAVAALVNTLGSIG